MDCTMRLPGYLLLGAVQVWASSSFAERIEVNTSQGLRAAMGSAVAGDEIHLAAGVYEFSGQLRTQNDGTPSTPIRIVGEDVAQTRLDFVSVEGLVFYNSDWVLSNVWVNGACAANQRCEAGVGVKQGAHRLLMTGCRVSNWVQHLKSARDDMSEVEDVSIVGNEFYNDRPIDGTPIDVVGGKRWLIADNYVHDYGGNRISYGIFIKGGTSDSVIERNLVIGAHDRPAVGVVLGISLGGGGTGAQFCPDGDCATNCEDRRSIVRNNIVAHCTDACFHTKRSCDGLFTNNLGMDCGIGLQVQNNGTEGLVRIENNLLDGRIAGGDNRSESNNVLRVGAALSFIYADPENYDFSAGDDPAAILGQGSDIISEVSDDYCHVPRSLPLDIGPFVVGAGCSVLPWSSSPIESDGGVPMLDAGQPDSGQGTADGGTGADAGRPPADGGVPALDAGSLLSDAGQAAIEGAGCTCAGRAQPSGLAIVILLGAGFRLISRRRR